MIISRKVYTIALILTLFFLLAAFSTRDTKADYYQAVYDTCIRLSAINGQVTSFDLLQCQEMEQHARQEQWHKTPMPEEEMER